ncbi:MAG: hypothetical protein ACRCVL_01960, partial [Cetobacterium sp.]
MRKPFCYVDMKKVVITRKQEKNIAASSDDGPSHVCSSLYGAFQKTMHGGQVHQVGKYQWTILCCY